MNKLLFLSTLIVFPLTLSNTCSFGLPRSSHKDVESCVNAFFKLRFGDPGSSQFPDLAKKYDDSDIFKENIGNAIEDNFGKFSIILRSGNIDLLASIDYIADKYWSKNHRLLLFLAICFETCALELACACKDTVIHQELIEQHQTGKKLADKDEYKNNTLRMTIINSNILGLTEFIRNKAKKIINILKRDIQQELEFKDRLFKKELDSKYRPFKKELDSKYRLFKKELESLTKELFAQNIQTDEYIKNRIKRIILYSDAYKAYSDTYQCGKLSSCDKAKLMYGQMLLHDCYSLILRFINTSVNQSGDSIVGEYQAIAMLRTFLVDAVKNQCLKEKSPDESVKKIVDEAKKDLKIE